MPNRGEAPEVLVIGPLRAPRPPGRVGRRRARQIREGHMNPDQLFAVMALTFISGACFGAAVLLYMLLEKSDAERGSRYGKASPPGTEPRHLAGPDRTIGPDAVRIDKIPERRLKTASPPTAAATPRGTAAPSARWPQGSATRFESSSPDPTSPPGPASPRPISGSRAGSAGIGGADHRADARTAVPRVVPQSDVAPPEGFEPPTPALGRRRSIH